MDMKGHLRKSSIPDAVGGVDLLIEKGLHQAFHLKFQTTVSMCFGLLLFSLFLFVFCTLDPGIVLEQRSWPQSDEARKDSTDPIGQLRFLRSSSESPGSVIRNLPAGPALQGMGTLFRTGTRNMSELIVAHLSKNTTVSDLRFFLRALHRSGATARADVVFLFPDAWIPGQMVDTIREEEDSFQKLLSAERGRLEQLGLDTPKPPSKLALSPFRSSAFWRSYEEDEGGSNKSSPTQEDEGAVWGSIIGFDMQELDADNALKGFVDVPSVQLRRWICYQMLLGMVRQRYQEVLLTEVDGVLIVGDALSAVRSKETLYLTAEDRIWSDLERVDSFPRKREIQGRRGGKGGREVLAIAIEGNAYKNPSNEQDSETEHTGLRSMTDPVHESSVLVENTNDFIKMGARPESKKKQPIRKGKAHRDKAGRGPQDKSLIESVYGNRVWNSLDKYDKSRNVVNSGVIMGDLKWIRVLTNKMIMEIVKVALERKNLRLSHDKALINYLVCKSSVLGKKALEHTVMVDNRNSVVHSLRGTKIPNVFFRPKDAVFAVVHGYRDDTLEKGRADGIVAAVRRDICSSQHSRLYGDCQKSRSETAL